MEKPQCSNCTYNHGGMCVRFPPQIVVSLHTGDAHSAFPRVQDDMWCGEYEMNTQRTEKFLEDCYKGL